MQPIKIRVTRGNFTESIHYAIACVSDSSGRIIQQWGNINKKDEILEVGPGTGNLTSEIIKKKPNNFI